MGGVAQRSAIRAVLWRRGKLGNWLLGCAACDVCEWNGDGLTVDRRSDSPSVEMVLGNRVGYRGSERADIHLGHGMTVRPNTLKQTVQGSKNHLQAGRAIRFHAELSRLGV